MYTVGDALDRLEALVDMVMALLDTERAAADALRGRVAAAAARGVCDDD